MCPPSFACFVFVIGTPDSSNIFSVYLFIIIFLLPFRIFVFILTRKSSARWKVDGVFYDSRQGRRRA